MNRNLQKLWLIVPDQLPTVIRRCPKCKAPHKVSRSQIKKWFDDGLVISGQEVLLPGARVMDGMLIQIKKEQANRQELLDV